MVCIDQIHVTMTIYVSIFIQSHCKDIEYVQYSQRLRAHLIIPYHVEPSWVIDDEKGKAKRA